MDRSARFRRRLAPLRRDLAAGAAGSAVPAGSSASCGALWAGAGSAVSAGFAAARLRRFPGLDAALFSGAGEGAAASWTGGGVSIGQLTLHGAVLPGQGGGQLLPSACPQQERRLETVLNGGAQSHLPERGGVSCVEGTHGGLISLVLADDIGEIRLSSSHQDAQLRDDLEVQGVLASLHALQILHLGLCAGAQLFHVGQGLPLAEKDQDGVLGSQQVDTLEPGANVVVAVHQKIVLSFLVF